MDGSVSKAVVDSIVGILAKVGRPLTFDEIHMRVASACTQRPPNGPKGWPYGVAFSEAIAAVRDGLAAAPGVVTSSNSIGNPLYEVRRSLLGDSSAASLNTYSAEAIDAAVVRHIIASIRKAGRPLVWQEIDSRLKAACGQPAGFFDPMMPFKTTYENAQRAARDGLRSAPGVTVSVIGGTEVFGLAGVAGVAGVAGAGAAFPAGLGAGYAAASSFSHGGAAAIAAAPALPIAPLLPAVRYEDLFADAGLHSFSELAESGFDDASASSDAAGRADADATSLAGDVAGEQLPAADFSSAVKSHFYTRDAHFADVASGTAGGIALSMRGVALAGASAAHRLPEAALLGTLDHWDPSSFATGSHIRSAAAAESSDGSSAAADAASDDLLAPGVWLNTHEPFCLAAIGVQGGGKSHTMGCILESCLVPFPEGDVVRLHQPMTTLVLHFDNSDASSCEATGLAKPAPELLRALGAGGAPSLPRDKMVILVSPSNFRARKAFYGDAFTVKPLLFRWASLTADHIKRIMNLNVNDGAVPLYVATMMDILRRYQRLGGLPPFATFQAEVETQCKAAGQSAPLTQRLRLLESVVAESALNARDLAGVGAGLHDVMMTPGVLAIADMTDPLLSGSEAAGVFEVLVEQFRTIHMPGVGKLLAVDEAHKFMVGEKNDGLSNALVNVARLMRHDGIRLAVSTQSPKALAPELLELVTVAVLHRFHSGDWLSYLSSKLPLPPSAAEAVMKLTPGHALVFASQHRLPPSASLVAHLQQQSAARAASSRKGKAGSLAAAAAAAAAPGWLEAHEAHEHAAAGDVNASGGTAEAGAPGPAAAFGEGTAARGGHVFQIHIRRRITADRGGSRVNAAARLQTHASALRGAPAAAVSRAAAGGAGASAASDTD